MIQMQKEGDMLTVVLDRQLNKAGAKALQEALRGRLTGVRHLVLDANGADVIDEAGKRCIELLDEKMLNTVDGTFRLVNAGDRLIAALESDSEWDWDGS